MASSSTVAELVVRLVDQATGPARAVNQAVEGLTRASRMNARQMNAVRGQMVDAAAAGYALYNAISAPVEAAIAFESAMADVGKVVDFDTPEQFAQMGDDILEMSTKIPMAADDIAAIVASAGQAGMAGDELLQFAEMAAKVGVAFGMSADKTGDALAKLKTALDLSVDDTSALAGAINHLSNSMASEAPAVIDYLRAVGSTGLQYGFTAEQTAAIGSAMIAAGADANVAATSFRNTGKALTKGEAATTKQKQAFKKLGLSSKKLAKDMQKDAAGTLRDVLSRIKQLPKEMQAATLSQIFGDEARALAPLLSNLELYDQALGLVANKQEYANSAFEEYEVRAATTEAKLQLLDNAFNVLAVTIGQALLPSVNDTVDALMPLVQAATDFAKANPELIASTIKLAGSLIALRVGTIAARYGYLFLKGAIIDTLLTVVKSAALVGRAGAFIGNAMLPVIGMSKHLRSALVGFQMLSFIGGGAFTALGSVIAGAATGVVTAIAGVTAPVWGLAAAIGLAIAGIGLVVWKYWEPISNFFTGLGEVIWEAGREVGSAIAGLVATLAAGVVGLASAVGGFMLDRIIDVGALFGIDEATMLAAVDQAVASIGNGWNTISSFVTGLPATLGNWLGNIFKMEDYSNAEEANFKQMGRDAGKWIVDGIKNGVNAAIGQISSLFEFTVTMSMGSVPAIVEWLKGVATAGLNFATTIVWPSLPAWLDALIGFVNTGLNFDLKIKFPEPPDWLKWAMSQAGNGWNNLFGGGQKEAAEKPKVGGTFADGGYMPAGGPYLVGEEGPELITPTRSGYVHTAPETASILSGLSAPRVIAAPSMPVGYANNTNAANANRAPDNGPRTISVSVGDIHLNNSRNASAQEIGDAIAHQIADEIGNSFMNGGG